MKIFRLILLALATALAVINFWTIDYNDLWGTASQWAYLRIAAAVALMVVLVVMIRKTPARKQRPEK